MAAALPAHAVAAATLARLTRKCFHPDANILGGPGADSPRGKSLTHTAALELPIIGHRAHFDILGHVEQP